MELSELFVGTYARLYTFTGNIVMLVMVLFMSMRLYASRRRKAFLSLTFAVAAYIFHYALLLGIAFADGFFPERIGIFVHTIQIAAFLMINRSIYQLYNSTKKRHHLYFSSSLVIAALLALFALNVPRLFAGAEAQLELLASVGLDLYLTGLILVLFWKLPPYIGQSRTYQLGLIALFAAHMSHIIDIYMLKAPVTALTFVELYAPPLYFFTLFLLLFERIVELMQASYRSSITDGLTGLYNRRYLLGKASQYIRYGYPVAIVFSDIDNFKELNDTQGHQAGDEALRVVARILQEESEEIGLVGRFGGEEMVVLITDSTVDAAEFAERVRARVEAESPVTVSIGFSKWRKGKTADELIAQADQAMYAAKASGKNKAVAYKRSLEKSAE